MIWMSETGKGKMKKWLLFLVSFGLFLPAAVGAEDLIRKGETLDLRRCIDIALIKHPNIQAAISTIAAGESRVGQARSGYYPQLKGSAGYSRTDPTSTSVISKGSAYNLYSSSISLNQKLYDFGKTTTQVKIQEFNRDSSHRDFDDVLVQLIFGVKQAYYGLLQARYNRDVAREVVGQFQQHLDQAKAFFEVGTKPKFDVTKADVDLSSIAETGAINIKKRLLRRTEVLGFQFKPHVRGAGGT